MLEARLAPALSAIGPWRWGGGAAADRLTHYYRGDRTVAYVEQPPADLARRLGLVPAADGPVLLVRAPGPLAFRSPHAETVHPLLVYADLLAEGHDRARDAAREIDARYLAPAEAEGHDAALHRRADPRAGRPAHRTAHDAPRLDRRRGARLSRPPPRTTADLDLAVVVAPDALAGVLAPLGWRRDARALQRWHGPEDVVADLLPAMPDLVAAGEVASTTAPER